MNAKQAYPKTLVEAVRYFSDLDVAHAFFSDIRWPHGVCCPRCGNTEVTYLAKYRRWECKAKHAKRQFTVKVGTVMEDSPMGLDKWAVAFWLEANAKNSISSYEVHRALGITQKSAWFMQHRIRLAMQTGTFEKMGGGGSGGVEVDEMYHGGLYQFMHKSKREKQKSGRGSNTKTAVIGMVERKGNKKHSTVRTQVVHDTTRKTIREIIDRNVENEADVFTDKYKGYWGLSDQYIHETIDHAIEYVNGLVHTNGIENFWSLFKRCVKGTHVSIEPFHLFRYLDAECFRFNNRGYHDGERFVLAVNGMDGRRLTYKALTSASEERPCSNDSIAALANENEPMAGMSDILRR
jgi:transposase-like protein